MELNKLKVINELGFGEFWQSINIRTPARGILCGDMGCVLVLEKFENDRIKEYKNEI